MFTNVAPVAPEISSVYRQGAIQYIATGLQQPAGGNNIIINGTGFASGCSVSFRQFAAEVGSASGSLITFIGSTQIYATTPALAVGVYDVVVINPDLQESGSSGDGLHESYEISSDTWGCLLQPGDYDPDGTGPGIGKWTDTSGNANHAVPYDVSPLDDAGCPIFSGTQSLVINESLIPSEQVIAAMASEIAGTVIIFFNSYSTELDAANYSNRALISGTGASPGMYHSALGLKSVSYSNNALYDSAYSPDPVSVGERHMGVMTWTDVLIRSIADCGTEGTNVLVDGIPNNVNTGSNTWIGRAYSALYKGTICLVAITNTVLPDLHLQKIREWAILAGHLPSSYFVPSVANDAGLFTWHRGDLGVTPGASISALLDQVNDDINKDLSTAIGSADPLWDAADVNFGDRASWGDDYANDTTSHMISGAFAAPLAIPFTSYDVVRVITDGGAIKYVRINNAGSGVGAAIYGVPNSVIATTSGAATIVADPGVDVTSIISVIFNGADSDSYINSYSTITASGDTDTGFTYSSLGTGSYAGEPGRMRQSEKIVSAGVHAHALRRKYIGYLGARYKLPVDGIPIFAPTITSTDFILGDPLGLNIVVITGTNFYEVSDVLFGVTSASFVVDSSTQITVTVPAHAEGAINITVINSIGTSNTSPYEYWSPLTPGNVTSFLEEPDYAPGVWTARSGFGASEAVSFPDNNSGTPGFVAVNTDRLVGPSTGWNNLIGTSSAASGTIACVLNVTNLSGIASNIICDAGFFGTLFLTPGPDANFYYYDSGYKNATISVPASGRMILVAQRDSSGTPFVKITLMTSDTVTWTNSATVGNLNVGPSGISIGYFTAASIYPYNGSIRTLVTAKTGWSDADVTKFYQWANSRHP